MGMLMSNCLLLRILTASPHCKAAIASNFFLDMIIVKTPPAKASGFELRLKAGLIGPLADCPLA
jgi:hypothetical protein